VALADAEIEMAGWPQHEAGMGYLYLTVAIISDVLGTAALKASA
jgi:hypothetical protein